MSGSAPVAVSGRSVRPVGLGHLHGSGLGRGDPADPRVPFVGYGDWTGPASATIIGVNASARRTALEAVAHAGPGIVKPSETRRSP